MTNPRFAALALAVASVAGTIAPAHADPASEAAGLDARLTNYTYPHPVQFHRFTAQGQRLEMAYMDVRPDRRARGTVVLFHGKNFSGAYWETTIAALTRAGYRVIVPDQIGFGKSSKPRNFQFSFQALAQFTHDLLDRVGARDVAVVGHSMGGMLAVRFALMFPDRTRQLALINPIGLEDWKRVVPYRAVDWLYERERARTPDKIRDYMAKAYFGGAWKPSYDPLIEILAGWTRGPDRDLIAWVSALTSEMVYTQPVLYEFPDLKVPTLLIIGLRDRTAQGKDLVPPETAKTLGDYPTLGRRAAAAIPGAELVEIEEAGHLPQVETPARTMDVLRRFLARETRRPGRPRQR